MYKYCAVRCSICSSVLCEVAVALGNIQINTSLHNGEYPLWLKLIQTVQKSVRPILPLQHILTAFRWEWKAVDLPKPGCSHDTLLLLCYSYVNVNLLSRLATQGHKITNIFGPKIVQRLFTNSVYSRDLGMVHVLKLDTLSLKKETVFSFIVWNTKIFKDSYVFSLFQSLGKHLLHKDIDFQKVTKIPNKSACSWNQIFTQQNIILAENMIYFHYWIFCFVS